MDSDVKDAPAATNGASTSAPAWSPARRALDWLRRFKLPRRERGSTGRRKSDALEGDVYFVAGFWQRFAAAAIDLAILLPVGLLLCKIAGALADLHLPASRVQGLDFWLDLFLAQDPALIGGIGLFLGIGCVYSLIFHISMGRTLGMRALKLRIIDVYGDEPSTHRALARTVGYLLGIASLGLGFVWIAFDSEKRGLQDWLAGTYVVKH